MPLDCRLSRPTRNESLKNFRKLAVALNARRRSAIFGSVKYIDISAVDSCLRNYRCVFAK